MFWPIPAYFTKEALENEVKLDVSDIQLITIDEHAIINEIIENPDATIWFMLSLVLSLSVADGLTRVTSLMIATNGKVWYDPVWDDKVGAVSIVEPKHLYAPFINGSRRAVQLAIEKLIKEISDAV